MKLTKIRLIEIELYSQCNRQCDFCPNAYLDRYTENIYMDDKVFIKVIDELVTAKYKGYISFSRYNEPFMHPEALRKAVDYIKEHLPAAKLISNTNGDYDNTAFRKDIEITEMDYDNNKVSSVSEDKRYRIMTLKDINNRGGSIISGGLPTFRDFPCLEPTYFVGIDYEGSVVPCCNFRHDVASHKDYILGNIIDDKLITILNSKKATKFRKDVKDMKFPPACKFCSKKEGRYTRKHPGITDVL